MQFCTINLLTIKGIQSGIPLLEHKGIVKSFARRGFPNSVEYWPACGSCFEF